MKADIPKPNPGLAAVGKSAAMRLVLLRLAMEAAQLYRTMAPVGREMDSGRLRASARAGVRLSDLGQGQAVPGDRLMGTVDVDAYYAVWNEMGAGPGKHPKSTGRMPKYGPFDGSHTFTQILETLRGT